MAGFYYRRQSPDSNFQPSREALADSFASKCRILEASSTRRLFSSIADSPVRLAPWGQLRKLKQLYVQAGFPVSALQ